MTAAGASRAVRRELVLGAEARACAGADGLGLFKGLAVVAAAHLRSVRLGPHVATGSFVPHRTELRTGAATDLMPRVGDRPARDLRATPVPPATFDPARRQGSRRGRRRHWRGRRHPCTAICAVLPVGTQAVHAPGPAIIALPVVQVAAHGAIVVAKLWRRRGRRRGSRRLGRDARRKKEGAGARAARER